MKNGLQKGNVVVLGGGLAGLSTLWHLQNAGCEASFLFEKESRIGGLTRSEVINGFTFDYTGHLLHFKNESVKKLVLGLLSENVHQVCRNSWIFSKEIHTRYPFQTNLFGLPPAVIKECILEFVRARDIQARSGSGTKRVAAAPSFEQWIHSTLGDGIARHFMVPYNEKLWTIPLRELTCEWMGRFVPTTSLEQILEGALSECSRNGGYNATFYYPLRGGIEALPRAFASSLSNVHPGHEVVKLDLSRKVVTFGNGQSCDFSSLVSTIPLPALLRAATGVPSSLRSAIDALRFTSVFNANLGVDRNLSDKHWVYFPEVDYSFYRVGFPHNFSPYQAPEGCSSIYAEIAYSPWKPLDKSSALQRVVTDLQKARVLGSEDRIVAERCLDIPCAYVIYDHQHRDIVTAAREFLSQHDIHSIGRYGAWEYSGMEDAIWQGKLTAEQILQ
jgi:protoporphyrinogen oxidase